MHTHVLYGVDDGSQSMEQSLEMLKVAEKMGFRGVVLTPHYMSYTNFDSCVNQNKKRFKELGTRIKKEGLSIQLFLGNEVYYEPELINLINSGEFTSINKSDYYLVETMRHDSDVSNLQSFLYRFHTKGYHTILAHPERYDFIQEDPNLLLDFMEKGTLVQLNLLSLIGTYGKSAQKTAEIMLEHRMVQFMASDAHFVRAYQEMEEALVIAKEIIDTKEFDKIMILNPAKVLSNKGIIRCDPITYSSNQRSFFSKK